MEPRTCKCGCGKSIEHKHKNAKFINSQHKDNYWNEVNPRGYGLEAIEREDDDLSWDAHKSC